MRTLVRIALLLTLLVVFAQPVLAKEKAEPQKVEHPARPDKRQAPKKPEAPKKPGPSEPAGKVPPGPRPASAPSPAPQHPASSQANEPPAPSALLSLPPNPRRFGYGASVADLRANGPRLRDMGFEYVKSYTAWSGAEPSRGAYNFADAQNIAADAERAGLRLVLRVDDAPAWAAAPGSGTRAPANPEDYGQFMGALAAALRGRVVAYEIWNEPNLALEWGGQRPNPEQYAELLRSAYAHVKAADPSALVVSAGLATTGGDDGATALDDLQFLRRMYVAGAKGSFDALGSHPYGFASAPGTRAANGMDFLRAADQYAVMVENGDGDKAVWATEIGWIDDPAAFGHPEYLNDPLWAGRQWQKVAPGTQADYLVQAYQYAYANWPWMGVMLLFNLDFSTAGYYRPAEQMSWYSVMNSDGTTRPAFDALRAMAKPVR